MTKRGCVFLLVLMLAGVARSQSLIKDLVANINELTLQNKAGTSQLQEEFTTISDNGRYNDVMILELYVAGTLPDAQVAVYINSIDSVGSWADINYKDKKPSAWEPAVHITRIHALTKVYKTPNSSYYNSPELSAVLHKALNFWFDANLVCSNWWYNQVGVPKMLGPALLLLKDELDGQEKAKAEMVMTKAQIGRTGQNKVWLSGNVLMTALFTDNLDLVQQARDSIVSEIYISTGEGLQPDNSFHQHGAQMQLGNYGLAYAGTISYWARVFANTSLELDADHVKYLRDYILEGLQWTVWRGYMDVNASARQVFNNAQKGKANSVGVTAINMMNVDPAHIADYKQFIYRNQVNPTSINTLVGHKSFPRSDYAIHRTPNWYASVRMHSERLIGYEMTNRENLQGIYSSDGVLILMLDGDEYNNIYPVWNWKRLPGTTVTDCGNPIAYSHPQKPVNQSDFVGSATDGRQGASAIIINKDGLTAHKSYFFINDLIVCLGAGITASDPVFTSLNQTIRKGDVLYSENKVTRRIENEEVFTSSNIDWVHHNNVGYYFFQHDSVSISNKTQQGDWSSIASFYKNMPRQEEVFGLYINHEDSSVNAKYSYCILPAKSVTELAVFSKKPLLAVLSNTKSCQAVSTLDGAMSQYVFYQPSALMIHKKKQLIAETSGILMLEHTKKGMCVTVSDPTQKLSAFTFVMDGKLRGENAIYDKSKKQTRISIPLPTQEGLRGGNVSVWYDK